MEEGKPMTAKDALKYAASFLLFSIAVFLGALAISIWRTF